MKIALFCSAIFFCTHPYAQDKKIKILNAEIFKKDTIIPDAQKLIGNVQFEHDSVMMYCDSAYLFNATNSLFAYSRVQVNQGDTINLFSDSLYFDGNTKLAKVWGNVRLRDRDYKLTTDSMDYDVKNSIGIYRNYGTITSYKDDNVLTSIIGRYEAQKKMMFFKDDVVLTNPTYVFKSDTLEYKTETSVAYFFGPTTIESDSTNIYCERGMYDTGNEIAQLVQEAIVITAEQTLIADSIYYEKKLGLGEGFGCVMLLDTTQKIHYTGEYAYRNENENIAIMYDDALLRQYDGEDTLYIHADTLKIRQIEIWAPKAKYLIKDTSLIEKDSIVAPLDSTINHSDSLNNESTSIEQELPLFERDSIIDASAFTDTLLPENKDSLLFISTPDTLLSPALILDADTTNRENDTLVKETIILGYYGVRWLRKDMRGKCDSLYYSGVDSLLRMYFDPIIFDDSTQISGDTIIIKTFEGKTDKFFVYGSSFILQVTDSIEKYYNQIKGKNMIGYMKANELNKVVVKGNGETIYFPEEKPGEYSGMNHIKCSDMIMFMQNKEVHSITFITEPDGVMYPIDKLGSAKRELGGFKKRFDERPNNSEDLIKTKRVTSLTTQENNQETENSEESEKVEEMPKKTKKQSEELENSENTKTIEEPLEETENSEKVKEETEEFEKNVEKE